MFTFVFTIEFSLFGHTAQVYDCSSSQLEMFWDNGSNFSAIEILISILAQGFLNIFVSGLFSLSVSYLEGLPISLSEQILDIFSDCLCYSYYFLVDFSGISVTILYRCTILLRYNLNFYCIHPVGKLIWTHSSDLQVAHDTMEHVLSQWVKFLPCFAFSLLLL